MRLWIASLLVGTGCNGIFGTNDVHLKVDDAALLVDASPFSNTVTGMAFNSAKVADPTTVAVTYPVVPGVTVEIGAMADVTAAALPALADAPVDATGTFEIPHELALSPYRIVLHPPGQVPVEYQTTLHATPGHFIVDIDIGRPERVTAPSTATLTIGPQGTSNTTYISAHIIETGSWASHYVGAVGNNPANAFTIAWSTSMLAMLQTTPVASQAGALSSPETGKGDRMFLVDASDNVDPNKGLANSYSVLTMDGFNGATPNNFTAATWVTVPTASLTPASFTKQPGFALAAARVNDATRTNMVSFDDNPVGGSNAPVVWSGVIPSTALPNFFTPGAGGKAIPPAQANGIGGVGVPTFAFMSTQDGVQLPYVNLFDGTIAPKFPQAIFARVSRSRMTNNVNITEGIQTISVTANATAPVDLAVGQAYSGGAHMKLNGTDIWQTNSLSWVIPTAPLMTFTFGVDGVVDDCVATLYTATSTGYVPKRRYLMPATANQGAPSGIVVERGVFDTNQDYVFGVACHLGYPNAVNGDWKTVAYPFSESVVYSFPFVFKT